MIVLVGDVDDDRDVYKDCGVNIQAVFLADGFLDTIFFSARNTHVSYITSPTIEKEQQW